MSYEYEKLIELISKKLDKPAKFMIDTFQRQLDYKLISNTIISILLLVSFAISCYGIYKTYKSYKAETWAYDDYYDHVSGIGFVLSISLPCVALVSILFSISSLMEVLQIIVNPNMYLLEMIKEIVK